MSDTDTKLARLEQRLQQVEDELAIHNLMISYGFAADRGDAERVASRFTEDGVYDVEGVPGMHGREGIKGMILGANHQSLIPNCGHTIGPLAVKVRGDTAVAIGYSRTYSLINGEIKIWRLAYNYTDLERRDGRWQILRRRNRMVGHDEAGALFDDGLIALED